MGKTAVANVNLPPRPFMGIESNGMLISAIHHVDGKEAEIEADLTDERYSPKDVLSALRAAANASAMVG